MEENINIQDYQDQKNIGIAKYEEAKRHAENMFFTAIKKANINDALKAAALYMKLDKLLSKRYAYGRKYGFDSLGKSK